MAAAAPARRLALHTRPHLGFALAKDFPANLPLWFLVQQLRWSSNAAEAEPDRELEPPRQARLPAWQRGWLQDKARADFYPRNNSQPWPQQRTFPSPGERIPARPYPDAGEKNSDAPGGGRNQFAPAREKNSCAPGGERNQLAPARERNPGRPYQDSAGEKNSYAFARERNPYAPAGGRNPYPDAAEAGKMLGRPEMNGVASSSRLPFPRGLSRHFVYSKRNPEMINRVFSEEDAANICWSNSKKGMDPVDRILADPFWTPDAHDEAVQLKIRRILDEIYEPEFLECSHGFRPGYSQMTCLKTVRRDFQGTVWFIGADMSKHLAGLDHLVTLAILKRKINDNQFLALVQKGFKGERLNVAIKAGASSEAMRSCAPIFTNIVLNELDRFCMRLKRKIDRGKLVDGRLVSWRTRDAAAQSPFSTDEDGNGNGDGDGDGHGHGNGNGKGNKSRRFEAARILQDNYSRRLHYVRFGNEVLCGVVGPHALADRLVALIIRFLKVRLGLHLTEEDLEVTRAKGERIPFLGYLIGRNPDYGQKLVHFEDGQRRVDQVCRPGKLILTVDRDKVIRRLAEKGFCTKGGEPRPNFRYFQQPQSESVSRIGAILKGLAEYYNLAESKKKAILYFNWIMRSSLAKTFAAKFKLRSQRKVYKRGTRDLSRPIARQSKSRGKNTYVPEEELKTITVRGRKQVRRMTGLPFCRSRYIPKPDLKPLDKDWKPRSRK